MSFAAAIAFLHSIAKAIPALRDLCGMLIRLFQELDEKRNKKQALERREAKDAAVDSFYSDAHKRMLSPEAKQRGTPDENGPSPGVSAMPRVEDTRTESR